MTRPKALTEYRLRQMRRKRLLAARTRLNRSWEAARDLPVELAGLMPGPLANIMRRRRKR